MRRRPHRTVTRVKGEFKMGKQSKSKRFIQQGKDSLKQHAARFPYRSTLEEAEQKSGPTECGGL